MSTREPDQKPQYKVPALEKGLEILELLAGESEGLTQKQVAERLGRTPDSLFRIFVCLESKGYLHRLRPADTYHLTSRLFVLAHQHPPTQRLIDAALPLMRDLSATNKQSCHLSIPTPEGLLVVAQADSPDSLGFAVRQGALVDIASSTSGLVYQAFSPDADERSDPAIRKIRKSRSLKRASAAVKGITDLASPVLDHRGVAVAVLNVPYVSFLTEVEPVSKVLKEVVATAALLSTIQGTSEN